MGLRGPPKTLSAILKLRGSLKEGPPPPQVAAKQPPRCPAGLEPEARSVWRRIVRLATTLGTMTEADAETLARYCRLLVLWKKCAAFVETNGVAYKLRDNDGKVRCFQQFPQVGAMNKLSVELLKLEREFGFTPAARVSLRVDDPQEAEPAVPARIRTA